MLERKAFNELLSWRRDRASRGLLITGARQVGKTTLVEELASKHYDAFVEINFYENPRAVETVAGARDSADLFMRLSVLGKTEIIPGRTLVFLDEIQECEDALTWLKFLVERTDCDYVFSGSRLGLDSFDPRSLPVGFLQTITMYPLDFEEFCWADGLPKSALAQVRASPRLPARSSHRFVLQVCACGWSSTCCSGLRGHQEPSQCACCSVSGA